MEEGLLAASPQSNGSGTPARGATPRTPSSRDSMKLALDSAKKKHVHHHVLSEREEWLRTTDEGAVSGGGSALDAAGSAARSRMEQRFLHRIGIGRLGPGFRYVREIAAGNAAVLEFECEIDGVHVNGIDLITCNADGRIVDFKVMVRPLQGINAIHARMGGILQQMKAAGAV